MILKSGRHEGKEIKDLSDVAYLTKLAKKTHDANGLRIVPHEIEASARARLKDLGYRFVGDRVEYDPPERPKAHMERPVGAREFVERFKEQIGSGAAPSGSGDDAAPGARATDADKSKTEVDSMENTVEEKSRTAVRPVKAEHICKECKKKPRWKGGLCWSCWHKAHGDEEKTPEKKTGTPLVPPGFGARVKAIREAAGFAIIRPFAQLLGVDNSRLGGIEKDSTKYGEESRPRLVDKILAIYPDISRAWLESGVGEMGTVRFAGAGYAAKPEDERKGSAGDQKGPDAEQKSATPETKDGGNETEGPTGETKPGMPHDGEPQADVMLTLTRHERTYIVTDGARQADIIFKSTGGGTMQFAECTVALLTNTDTPTYGDWMFLGAVSREIEVLAGRMSL